jgi:hypothetical protein
MVVPAADAPRRAMLSPMFGLCHPYIAWSRTGGDMVVPAAGTPGCLVVVDHHFAG